MSTHTRIAAAPARPPESVKDLARTRPFFGSAGPAFVFRPVTTTANPPLIARVIATKRAIGIHRGLPDQPRVAREQVPA